jgi:predicted transcriptional regulator
MSLHMRQDETVTFRIDATLKAELNRLATEKDQSLGALIRDLAEQRVA